jgi:polyhydroxyalkanoate synthase
MLRWLAAEGFRPLLLDWGVPGPAEARFDLDDYGAERLVPALEAARRLAGGPVPVLGYCMGGTLAVGLAARRPADVAALVTIGAPWDFASTRGVAGGIRAMLRANGIAHAEALIDGLGDVFGQVPVSVFQTLFAMVNPIQASLKFQKLARLDPDGPVAQLFVALEDWLAEGVPMPAGAARDLLIGWHIRNLTATGRWRFLGGIVDPGAITAPALIVSGERDSIAPPPLAQPLARAIPGARALSPKTGHVGMVVGSLARPQVWRPIAGFLATVTDAVRPSG